MVGSFGPCDSDVVACRTLLMAQIWSKRLATAVAVFYVTDQNNAKKKKKKKKGLKNIEGFNAAL